mmetsp:Transcript_10305/g.28112  ORF Transcript_10305/g.28112 Transcript_10305/m.28112 type:complete len:345 (+) Transcript_10305:1628-2662(+)
MRPTMRKAVYSRLELFCSASLFVDTTVPVNTSYSYLLKASATIMQPSWGGTTVSVCVGARGEAMTLPKLMASCRGRPRPVIPLTRASASVMASCLHSPRTKAEVVRIVAGGQLKGASSSSSSRVAPPTVRDKGCCAALAGPAAAKDDGGDDEAAAAVVAEAPMDMNMARRPRAWHMLSYNDSASCRFPRSRAARMMWRAARSLGAVHPGSASSRASAASLAVCMLLNLRKRGAGRLSLLLLLEVDGPALLSRCWLLSSSSELTLAADTSGAAEDLLAVDAMLVVLVVPVQGCRDALLPRQGRGCSTFPGAYRCLRGGRGQKDCEGGWGTGSADVGVKPAPCILH